MDTARSYRLDELLVSGNELTPVVDQAVKVADGKTLYRRLLSVPVGQCGKSSLLRVHLLWWYN